MIYNVELIQLQTVKEPVAEVNVTNKKLSYRKEAACQ